MNTNLTRTDNPSPVVRKLYRTAELRFPFDVLCVNSPSYAIETGTVVGVSYLESDDIYQVFTHNGICAGVAVPETFDKFAF